VTGQFLMAVETGVEFATALELDGNDIEMSVEVGAT